MVNSGGKAKTVTGAAALALLLVPAALAAQTQGVPDFSIPTGRPTSNPRAQGPVDADAPIIRAPVPRPSPTPSPVPVASPTSAPSAATGPAAAPRTTAAPRSGAPAPRIAPVPAPITSAAPSPSTSAPTITPFPLPSSSTVPGPVPTIDTAGIGPEKSSSASIWPWIAGTAALLAALFAGLWWRSRCSAKVPQLEFIPPVVRVPVPAELQAAAPAPVPLPEPQLSAAAPAALPPGLGLVLEARRMSASLMATTLSYTLTLTNNSPDTLSALAIEGDMIAAHASLPPEQQIASQGERLELRHALVTLAPGESAEFKGDFRLPLTSLNPIRSGNAAFFVPLARLRVEASTSAGEPLVKAQTWVVGETGDTPGAGLRPFRLDLGPRTYSKVGQRAVN